MNITPHPAPERMLSEAESRIQERISEATIDRFEPVLDSFERRLADMEKQCGSTGDGQPSRTRVSDVFFDHLLEVLLAGIKSALIEGQRMGFRAGLRVMMDDDYADRLILSGHEPDADEAPADEAAASSQEVQKSLAGFNTQSNPTGTAD